MIVEFPFDLMTKNVNIEIQSDKVKLLMPKIKKSINTNEALKKIEKRIMKNVKNAKSIAILIDDHTRPTPTAETLEFLLKRIDGKDIKIIFAKGTHETPSEEYIKEKIGSKIFKNYNIIIHDAYDESIHEFVGITKYGTPVWLNKEFLNADFRIGIGSIFPSEIAGFTGGYKIVLPGIAYYETINKNHSMFISPNAECGRIYDNPVRLDIDDAGKLSGLNITIDYVLNPN
ncbi:MAG: lactate racemase domain-containing protein, partial [Nitrososphaerota archaeon]